MKVIGSRTPHGVRELKLRRLGYLLGLGRRTPHGVRELKPLSGCALGCSMMVAPRTGCVN